MEQHLFISYSRIDGIDLADRLIHALRTGEPSFSVWLDRSDIPVGFRFTDELDEAIKQCHSVIYLMTPDSVSRESFCPKEIARADRYRKPILPILAAKGVIPPIDLELAHYLDMTGDFQKAVDALKERLLWTNTPAGQLKILERHRAWLARWLSSVGEEESVGKRAEISSIEQRIQELKQFLADPARATEIKDEKIRGGMESVRQQANVPPAQLSSKFINAGAFVAPLHFQDRHAETGLVVEFLRDPSLRLLTIVGRGGVGKTGMVCRLLKAIEAGRLPDDLGELDVTGLVYLSEQRMRRVSFPHLFEDLARLLDPGYREKAQAVYRSPQMSTTAKMHSLLSLLPSGMIIVLLDNFEELVATADHSTKDREVFDAVSAWLHAPPNEVKMIITTRVSPTDLSLADPVACREMWLDEGLPSPHAENLLRQLDGDGAVGLRSASLSRLSEAAGHVRGYPRALEALYAVLRNDKNTSLDEILQKAAAALPEKVVEVMVGEAFSRLDIHEKIVLQALAIFNRPIPVVAIDFLLQPFMPAIEAGPILRWLVDLQIVRKDGDRYYLHPVDAAYSLSQIPEAASVSAVGPSNAVALSRQSLLARAAEYFREIRKPITAWRNITDIEPQLAEFDLLCLSGRYDDAASILLQIGFKYLRSWGHVRTLIGLHERLRDRVSDKETEAHCLGVLGTAYWDAGRLSQGIADLRKCIALTEETTGSMTGAAWWCDLGCCLRDVADTDGASAAHERALLIDEHIGDWSGVGSDLNNLAECYADRGIIDTASQAVDLAIDAIPFVDGANRESSRLTGYRLATMSKFEADAGRWPEASKKASEALAFGQKVANSEVIARAGYYLALSSLSQGDLERAQEALSVSLHEEYPRFKFRSLLVQGIALLAQKEVMEAGEAFMLCRKECEDLLSRSPEHYLANIHSALAQCGLFICGREADIQMARDILTQCTALRQYQGIRSRCLHLLRLIAKYDTTRQVKRLALVIDEPPAVPSKESPPDKYIIDHKAVRKLRAMIVPVRLTQLHAHGQLRQCAGVAADSEPVYDMMLPQQRMECIRVRAWTQARLGFCDGPKYLDSLCDATYMQSLLRVSDYMAVYRFQGLSPALEVREWFERGCQILAENNIGDSGADVLLHEYQGCALLARAECGAAEQLLQKALAAENAGKKEVRILARIQGSLGDAFRLLGDAGKAERFLEVAAALQEEQKFEGDLCEYTLPSLAKLHAGDPAAIEYLGQAKVLAENLEHRKALLRVLLLEARLGDNPTRHADILTSVERIANDLPAVLLCPLWRRIQNSWSEWLNPTTTQKSDFWGL